MIYIKTILGIFADRDNAVAAIDKLKSEGYNAKDFSILMRDNREGQDMVEDTGTNVAGGAVTGATTGAVLGGLAGLVSAMVLPGLGAFFIGGPIASALGLTGAAATTASGAATGALAGGILGSLTGLGLSENEASYYEEKINSGAILLAVPVMADDEAKIEKILTAYDADDIKSVSNTKSEDRIEIRGSQSETEEDISDENYSSYNPSYHTTAGAKGGKTRKTSSKKDSDEEYLEDL